MSSLWPVNWGRTGAWFTDGSAWYAGATPKWNSYSAAAPLWDNPGGQWREVLPVGRSSSCVPGCWLFLEREIARGQIYTDSWAVANNLAGWPGTWKVKIKNLVTGKSGKRYVNKPLWLCELLLVLWRTPWWLMLWISWTLIKYLVKWFFFYINH